MTHRRPPYLRPFRTRRHPRRRLSLRRPPSPSRRRWSQRRGANLSAYDGSCAGLGGVSRNTTATGTETYKSITPSTTAASEATSPTATWTHCERGLHGVEQTAKVRTDLSYARTSTSTARAAASTSPGRFNPNVTIDTRQLLVESPDYRARQKGTGILPPRDGNDRRKVDRMPEGGVGARRASRSKPGGEVKDMRRRRSALEPNARAGERVRIAAEPF